MSVYLLWKGPLSPVPLSCSHCVHTGRHTHTPCSHTRACVPVCTPMSTHRCVCPSPACSVQSEDPVIPGRLAVDGGWRKACTLLSFWGLTTSQGQRLPPPIVTPFGELQETEPQPRRRRLSPREGSTELRAQEDPGSAPFSMTHRDTLGPSSGPVSLHSVVRPPQLSISL